MEKLVVSIMLTCWLGTTIAQTDTEVRMERDIRVAENVLSSLIKQQMGDNVFVPVQIEGSYRSGFGITFSVPNNSVMNWMFVPRAPKANNLGALDNLENGYTYSIETNEDGDVVTEVFRGQEEENIETSKANRKKAEQAESRVEQALKNGQRNLREVERNLSRSWNNGYTITGSSDAIEKDSKEYNKMLIDAAKTFLADYSSILSQIKPEERVVITNRANEGANRYRRFMGEEKRFFLSVEVSAADIKQYQVSKINREQFVGKIKVVESEVESERSQDLELLNTIFDRLYQPDLSTTFFTEDNTYYERLKEYGAIFYMQVFSSNQMDRGYFSMPTQKGIRLTEAERNKKVTELYPVFEKELKENILEYGRTLKSLKPEEVLVFNVKITKCVECDIPSTLELSIKFSVLTDYMQGKIGREAALAKMDIKKGAKQ